MCGGGGLVRPQSRALPWDEEERVALCMSLTMPSNNRALCSSVVGEVASGSGTERIGDAAEEPSDGWRCAGRTASDASTRWFLFFLKRNSYTCWMK
ncbi:hypothetical protein CEXT_555241 [Caerostris extrusa]|uniref:Uncharacterized protein n=1 Tax=Caerostris extrusa TaxID=172846 RepID=A0AAV4NAN7_CAEEX|nr:hypothetical protein CEXT_555241 [Caerostris extrusa]